MSMEAWDRYVVWEQSAMTDYVEGRAWKGDYSLHHGLVEAGPEIFEELESGPSRVSFDRTRELCRLAAGPLDAESARTLLAEFDKFALEYPEDEESITRLGLVAESLAMVIGAEEFM